MRALPLLHQIKRENRRRVAKAYRAAVAQARPRSDSRPLIDHGVPHPAVRTSRPPHQAKAAGQPAPKIFEVPDGLAKLPQGKTPAHLAVPVVVYDVSSPYKYFNEPTALGMAGYDGYEYRVRRSPGHVPPVSPCPPRAWLLRARLSRWCALLSPTPALLLAPLFRSRRTCRSRRRSSRGTSRPCPTRQS